MSVRLSVPPRFTDSIHTWLRELSLTTYTFEPSITHDMRKKRTVCIGDIHADPRGFTSALFISSLITKKGEWIGGDTRVILNGDVLDGGERMGPNPDVTPWDELLCLRMIFTLKEEAQKEGGDIIWVLGNHDIAASMATDSYLHPVHAKGYAPYTRHRWFLPGMGILALYMAKCGIIGGRFHNLLVSHAGVLKRHLPFILTKDGYTQSMRLFLTKNQKDAFLTQWYSLSGPMMHRTYDVQPGALVSEIVQAELTHVAKETNTKYQVIGHNCRPGIQKISVRDVNLFLIDTGISRSFGPTTKVQCLEIQQETDTITAFCAEP